MNDFDLDGELKRALRDTHEEASAGFTARVVRRLDDPPARARWNPRPALAAASLLAVGLLAGSMIDFGAAPTEAPVETVRADPREELRREYRALEEELAQIRELATEQTPVLYLGGDDSFDLVYDLAEYPGGTANGMRPASLPDRG